MIDGFSSVFNNKCSHPDNTATVNDYFLDGLANYLVLLDTLLNSSSFRFMDTLREFGFPQ